MQYLKWTNCILCLPPSIFVNSYIYIITTQTVKHSINSPRILPHLCCPKKHFLGELSLKQVLLFFLLFFYDTEMIEPAITVSALLFCQLRQQLSGCTAFPKECSQKLNKMIKAFHYKETIGSPLTQVLTVNSSTASKSQEPHFLLSVIILVGTFL